MAKRAPGFTLEEMEAELGYKIDQTIYQESDIGRFYSDLSLIPESLLERTQVELKAHARQRRSNRLALMYQTLPSPGTSIVLECSQHSVTLTRRSNTGCVNFAVDLDYSFGLQLPLLLTTEEALMMIGSSRLHGHAVHGLGPLFSKLPLEVREKIYDRAIPGGVWRAVDVDNPKSNFPEAAGDYDGFYFPLTSLSLLKVNRQMRHESLPLAYRKTHFQMDDMDDVIQILVAVGVIGRENIRSLEFTWQSRSDVNSQCAETADIAESTPALPKLHATECVRLLKQCKSLKWLRVCFDADVLEKIDPNQYAAQTGICELSSLRGIERVDICGLSYEALPQETFSKYLKESMESCKNDI